MPASLIVHVGPHQCGGQQRAGIKRRRPLFTMVAFLVDLARQLGDGLLLQRSGQRMQGLDALEVGACALGVLANPVRKAGRRFQRAIG
jgi:hypothetical protein